ALVKAISDLKNALPDSAAKTGAPPLAAASPKGAPGGIRIERTPAGFVLRVSAGSFGYAIAWLVFAGVLAVLPFRLGAKISAESFQGGQGIAWTLWAAALLVPIGGAVFAWFSQIRITKTGHHGENLQWPRPFGPHESF